MRQLTWLMVLFAIRAAAEPFTFRADFEQPNPADIGAGWRTDSIGWEVAGGRLHGDDAVRALAVVADCPRSRTVSMETSLRLRKSLARDWKVAGLVFHDDDRHYWGLHLVESPEKEGRRHFVELAERMDEFWPAQGREGLALPAMPGGSGDFQWEFGVTYRLRLQVTGRDIVGEVTDEQGTRLWWRGYRLDNQIPASRFGVAAIVNAGFDCEFDDIRVAAAGDAPDRPKSPPPPPYDAPAASDIRSRATGFFRVEKFGDTWWVVDPKGVATYLVGTDHVRYQGHWCEKLGYAPYGRNMRRQFPDENDWAKLTVQRLRAWGFNLLAAGHSLSTRHRGLAHTEFITFGAVFSQYSDIAPKEHWTGFPNVFDPKWSSFCDKRARRFCEANRDDPWLVGYFLDNELEWYGKNHREYGLVDEAFKKPADHTAKRALVAFLQRRHDDIAALNTAWGADYASWQALAASTTPPGERADGDKRAFLREIAERYFETTTAAIRRHDPNHMIIGCRFAGRSPGIWDICGKHCDIVTVNYYGRIDFDAERPTDLVERFTEYHEQAGRPLMITEWSFPALDSGLPCKHGAGMRVDTQERRALAFDIYQRALFAMPFVVGSDFFMFVDEPALGISSTFPEDTNYGLVNEQNEPYQPLTAACSRLNPQAVTIHGRRGPDLAVALPDTGDQVAVTNRGDEVAQAYISITVNGRQQRTSVNLDSGASVRLPLPSAPAARYVRVVADPERSLPESDRSDNTAARSFVADDDRAWLLVTNPTPVPLSQVLIEQDRKRLPPLSPRQRIRFTAGGRVVPFQLVGDRVFLRLPKLDAYQVQSVRMTRSAAPAVSPPAMRWRKTEQGFELDNGRLRLEKRENDGDMIDRILLDGFELGGAAALMHQRVGQDLWVQADTSVAAEIHVGPCAAVLDITAAYRGGAGEVITAVDDAGRPSQRLGRPHRYRAVYRFLLAPGQPWMAARLLSVTNTDPEPWLCRDYFFFLHSRLGGDASDDVVGGPDVPNFFRPFTAWRDEAHRASYGVVTTGDLQAHFWIDGGGGRHPDARRAIERELRPGDVYAEREPWLYIWGARGEPRLRHPVVDELEARAKVRVESPPS